MSYTVHIQPGGYTFSANLGETVLEAALRNGYQFPYCCQNAICGECKGQLLEGQVRYDVPIYALNNDEREMGYALFCAAKPVTDLLIYVEHVIAPSRFPIRRHTCPIVKLEKLSGHLLRIFLSQPVAEPLIYQAGQYLEILHLDASPKPYSIANAPLNDHQLELHIRHLPNSSYTKDLVQEIHDQKKLRVAGPYGAMVYQRIPAYPLLMVAGGTGFAPFKAIIEQALRDLHRPPIYLYWGVRHRPDLYWHREILRWVKQYSNIYYTPVLSEAKARDHWCGATGLVHEVVLKQHQNLSRYHIYLSGPPEMVYAAQHAFVLRGASKTFIYSDMFDYPLN